MGPRKKKVFCFFFQWGKRERVQGDRYQAELDTLLAVSTVPPSTTSFMPSMTEEPAVPPTKG